MKKIALYVAAVALACARAGGAGAACDFDVGPAKGLKASMVRVYAACPGTESPVPNIQTEGGVEACTPVTPAEVDGSATLYTYGPKGGCTVQFSAKLVAACDLLEDDAGTSLNLPGGACHVTFVKAKCKNILGIDGLEPIGPGDTGFTLATVSRATLADDVNGDVTVVDFPVSFTFDEPKNGSMKLASNSAVALAALIGPTSAHLPECTSIELVSVVIKDPGNLPFATLGGATVP